ncbi:hypothetical protein CspeluHIS016_0304040 [Cutaneotrichosporon spelunceum]|uniref:ATP-NAD kinase n=1 Tax=Cutaneotrichosporon spelunceum TaxID=1672016 RepID=A0AAD3TTJ9_9TREE|nr:hypothetical protein CspeluHIS016_0304040 [Cutaneotrichosporon spelunceum]
MSKSHVNGQGPVPIPIVGSSTSSQLSPNREGSVPLPTGTRPTVSSPLSQQVSLPKASSPTAALGVSSINPLGMSNVYHTPGPLHPPAKKKVHISPEVDNNETPYYIHSGIDKHGALSGWLRGKHENTSTRQRREEHNELRNSAEPSKLPAPPRPRRPGILKPLTPAHPPLFEKDERIDRGYESEGASTRFDSTGLYDDEFLEYHDDDDEDEDGPSSLSRQLAETAQGVREVSRELGRTRVRSRIQTILIVTKARDNRLITLTRELALYCMLRKPSAAASTTDVRQARNTSLDRGMIVYVDNQLRTSKRFDAAGMQRDYPQLFEPIASRRRSSNSASASASSVSISTMASSWSTASGTEQRKDRGQLRYWTAEMCSNSPQLFDFVVTLGGDGTVLFTSWLFQRIVPPVLPFALGSLGFLTNFDFKNYQDTIDKCIDDGIRVNLRMRFTCTVYRAVAPDASVVVGKGRKRKAIRKPGGEILIEQVDRDGWEALEGGTPIGSVGKGRHSKDKEIMCFTTRPVEQFEVLNDLVVDRGPSPFVSLLEVFGDDHHLTTVQADGLTVSTPTGSTAYSLSAGGSLVHPGIPAILITPICPHTLSFRPMLLPDGIELRVCVPYNSRSTAWASFDGRGRVELKQGDHIKITASKYPFPTVCADKQSTDWFRSIQRTLKWNERERQKSFVVVEEDHPYDHHKEENGFSDGDGEHSSDDSSEDDFDIDDRSTGELTPPPKDDTESTFAPSKPMRVHTHLRHLRDDDEFRSGVQSPDRFQSSYQCPPPISQRHLFDALAKVESKLNRVEIQSPEDEDADESSQSSANRPPSVSSLSERTPIAMSVPLPVDHEERAEAEDQVHPLPEPIPRTESDMTLAPPDAYDRAGRRSNTYDGGRTPRQGRSRSRSRAREVRASSNSRSGSPQVGARKPKAFAFFGHDDSQSEVSDDE